MAAAGKLTAGSHSWYLDDIPPHMFIKGSHASHGYVDADVTLKLWKAHFDYFYREEDWFVFPLTLHPDTAGRPHVLMTVEKLIEYIKTFEGVEFCTMAVRGAFFEAASGVAVLRLMTWPHRTSTRSSEKGTRIPGSRPSKESKRNIIYIRAVELVDVLFMKRARASGAALRTVVM